VFRQFLVRSDALLDRRVIRWRERPGQRRRRQRAEQGGQDLNVVVRGEATRGNRQNWSNSQKEAWHRRQSGPAWL